jgi:tartrate-resistant acid phosphatase type 5
LYSVNVNTNNGALKLIKFIFIDTIVLCGNVTNHEEPVFSSPKARRLSNDYLERLQSKIKTAFHSAYKYIILVGHFPVWAIAEHGPTRCLVEKLRPLIHAYQVNAYLCGHEHDMEHLNEPNIFMNEKSVDYIVSGAGATPFYSTANSGLVPNNTLKFYWASDLQLNGAFAFFDANEANIKVSFVESSSSSSKPLYRTVLHQSNRTVN